MKTEMASHPCRAYRVFSALLFTLATACTASAWNYPTDTVTAWNGFNSRFQYGMGAGMFDKQVNDNSGTTGKLWEDAELIEAAEDTAEWAGRNGIGGTVYTTEVNKLCTAWEALYPKTNWSDPNLHWYDDQMWACQAFIRAYQINPGKPGWLTQAQALYDWVWTHAQNSNGGLNQQPGKSDPQSNVNFGAVIAGYLIYNAGGGSKYKTEADTIWNWATGGGTLCDPSTGKVNDGLGTSTTDYAYNYGIALKAATLENQAATAQKIADYLINNFVGANYKYNAPQFSYGGALYNLLPNYNQWMDGTNFAPNGNDVGYDGICMRGFGYAYRNGYLRADQLTWARANKAAAEREINDTTYRLIWTDWNSATPDNGTAYSWNCSSGLSVLVNIPSVGEN
jgi:hypothetical protein